MSSKVQIMRVLQSLKAGDTIEIIPEKGKVRQMKVVRPYEDEYKGIEITSGRKRTLRQTKNGMIKDYGNGFVWQPTLLTQVEGVKSVKLVGAEGFKLV